MGTDISETPVGCLPSVRSDRAVCRRSSQRLCAASPLPRLVETIYVATSIPTNQADHSIYIQLCLMRLSNSRTPSVDQTTFDRAHQSIAQSKTPSDVP